MIAMSQELRCHPNTVVGALIKVWGWANENLVDGNAPVTPTVFLDEHSGLPGLAKSMLNCGWLSVLQNGFALPNFDRWNSQGVKRRILTANRVKRHRYKKCNASVTQNVTHEALPKKRREENILKNSTSSFLPPKEKKVRERNPIWDAIAEKFYPTGVPKKLGSKVGLVVTDLKAKGATPEQIAERFDRAKTEWDGKVFGPEALVNHWDQLAAAGGVKTSSVDIDQLFKEGEAFREQQAQRLRARKGQA